MMDKQAYSDGRNHAKEVSEARLQELSWDDAEGVPPEKALALMKEWQEKTGADREERQQIEWNLSYWQGYLSIMSPNGDVSFTWDDGPNAAAEFHRLYAFSPDGEKIEPRKELVSSRKNGKWSYATWRMVVPTGSVIIQHEQNTHRHAERRAWIATYGRPEVFSASGSWSSESTWPQLDKRDVISQDAWRKMLRSFLNVDIVAQYERNATIEAI